METPDTKPLFTLTAEEVEVVRKALCLLSNDMVLYLPANPFAKKYFDGANNLLIRIKQWQDENENKADYKCSNY